MATNLGNLIMPSTSRYAGVTSGGGGAQDSRTTGTSSGTGSTSSTSQTSGSSSSSSSQTSSTKNMSSANETALNTLIQMLLGGGTPEMRAQQATRNQEIGAVRDIRGDYSKDAAFGDAQGLISQQMRRTLESLLPSINRAAEDAGSSGGALRALLLQDVAQRAAESSSALGVQTATNYGNISASLSGVLEGLTRVNPAATEALLTALGIAKGVNPTTTTNTNQTGTTNSTTQNSGNTSSNSSTSEERDYLGNTTQQSTTPIYFGPEQSTTQGTGIGSTLDTLMQLAKDTSWSNYTF